jgi:two-component system alkaline phosphatase synthesis response regulator PhoP
MTAPAKKILLIEDSKPLRQVLAERLIAAGFAVSEANGGEEGLRIALEEKPDLIVTDIIMFPLDGLELARRVRESGVWGEQVHIVALTNQDSTQEKTRLEPLNLSAYIIKAETPLDEIVKKVQQLFKEAK